MKNLSRFCFELSWAVLSQTKPARAPTYCGAGSQTAHTDKLGKFRFSGYLFNNYRASAPIKWDKNPPRKKRSEFIWALYAKSSRWRSAGNRHRNSQIESHFQQRNQTGTFWQMVPYIYSFTPLDLSSPFAVRHRNFPRSHSFARSARSWINSFAVCVTHFTAEKYLYFICILGAQRGNKKWLEEGFHNIFRWKYMILHASGLAFRVYVLHSCWDLYARHKVTRW